MGYVDDVLADGPLGFWPMQETAGTTLTDSSGNARNGTYLETGTGDPTYGVTGLLNSDPLATAVDFTSSSSSYAQVAAAAWMGTAALTVELMIETDSTAQQEVIARANTQSNISGGTNIFRLVILTSGRMFARVYSATTTTTITSATGVISTGTPHHIAFTQDATNGARLYVDGVQVGSAPTIGATSTDTTRGMTIGRSADTGSPFDGRISHVALYNYALTSTQVADHSAAAAAAGGTALEPPAATATASALAPTVTGATFETTYADEVLADGPQVYLRLEESSGATASDSSGNGNHGSYVGTITYGVTGLIDSGTAVSTGADGDVTAPVSITGDELTVEAWWRGTAESIVWRDHTATSSEGFFVYFTTATNAYVRMSGTNRSAITLPYSVFDDEPHHVVVTYDDVSTDAKFYLDGALLDTWAVVGAGGKDASNFVTPLHVGRNGSTTQYYPGVRDEVAVYPAVLSAARVLAHYEAGVTSGGVSILPPAATATAAAPVPTVTIAGGPVNLAPPAATATAAAPVPTIGLVVPGGVSVDPPAATATAEALAPHISGLAYPTTATNVRFPTPVNGSVVAALLPVTPPARINEWPVTVTAHPMPALADNKRRVKPGIDYTPLRGTAGRLHIWVNDVDVTYLRDVPTIIDDWSSSDPMADDAARFTMRQIGPWEDLGAGDLAPFDMDADPIVDIALLAEDGSLTHLWDGHIVSEDDTTTSSDEARVFVCEGTLKAAAHSPHMPPTIMDETDIGIVIPRVLNGTPNRRFAPLAETITGITTSKRGSQDQSRLGYVQMLLATAFTDAGVQWTIEKIAPRKYALTLKDDTGHTAEIVKGAIGVELDVKRDEGMRWDGLYGEGVAPNGGHWGNWFFPGLDLFVPPPYPYTDTTQTISTGDTDAGTDTGDGVTVAQRRLVELGYSVAVTGTFTSADAAATSQMQTDFGLLVDGRIGPQTWTAMFTPGLEEIDLQAVRLPLASKDWVLPNTYAANGAATGENPAWAALPDPKPVPKLPNVKYGADITKAQATVMSRRMLAANGEAAWTGRITLTSDPVDASGVPFSRFLLREGDRVKITGHDGGVILRVADASKDGITVTLEVDERNRNAMTLDAIRERNLEARSNTTERPGSPSKISSLTRDHIVQFEDESKAGQIPAYPVNGNVGLWSVFPIVVSQTGRIAKLDMDTVNDVTTFVVAFFGRPIEPQHLASMVPDPISDADGWREHEEALILNHAWIETFGQPGSLAGYHPWQQSDGRAVTGKLRDHSGLEFTSERRGYLWVAVFSSESTVVSGRAYPAVPS